ncbi:tRNA 2-selenouridine(34) synthase MnmH [Peptoniphilus indolicus]|uniref:tRNA 2-selenouridine synthase n=2 Tax=Peptoniphilus indolicus TaxID=33030 RepID=G4D160_9FIRM|nr:tRNA 2-selenouridine(34) synthase MnmH [Peptoniphilus indolicus]EGY80737.1 tRNA 2-selenouridine synthase [Peptoniphilus indolicus ATCC 29427]SUB74843.1 tRNA 2-selenouridine synthase [Peptoniphilus indolicus]
MKFEISPKDLFEYSVKNEIFILIDMRSPIEFKSFNIPEAINFPILNNEERKIVGTLFDNGEIDRAKSLSVKYAAAKLPTLFDNILELVKNYDHVILYCARGGYRSTVFFQFLRSLGVPVKKLVGGYKAYRKYIRENLEQLVSTKNFVVLHGKTGVGKTEILNRLKSSGLSILNLEELANHRGSSFGSLGLNAQPSQKQFESLLYNSLLKTSDLIFLEGESSRIGNILLPKYLLDKMYKGTNIVIEDTIENRVARIKRDYVNGTKEEINSALDNLSKYISEDRINSYKSHVENNDLEFVIKDLILNYYDSHYAINYSKDDLHLNNDELILENLQNFMQTL